MSEFRAVSALTSCLFLLGAVSLFATDPAAVAALTSGDLAILDASEGIVKVSGASKSQLVPNFGVFRAIDFTAARLADGDALFVTLHLQQKANTTFTRLSRWSATGRKTGEWPLRVPGGVLAGVAVDQRQQIVYCSDSHLGEIYKLDLKNRQPSFVSLLRVREPGTLGPMVFDARRQRLLVADVKKGRILAVTLSDNRVDVLLDQGTIREPLALALDSATDRLYIADATKGLVWVGSVAGTRLTAKPFSTSYRFREPVGLAWSGRTLWVLDRETKRLSQFAADGSILKHIGM